VNQRKLQHDPKVKEFLDIEVDQGKEFEIEGSTCSDCSSSDDL